MPEHGPNAIAAEQWRALAGRQTEAEVVGLDIRIRRTVRPRTGSAFGGGSEFQVETRQGFGWEHCDTVRSLAEAIALAGEEIADRLRRSTLR